MIDVRLGSEADFGPVPAANFAPGINDTIVRSVPAGQPESSCGEL